ncbi:MAG: metal ABC transporter ATP-binding protein [Desulfobacterales bacterium]
MRALDTAVIDIRDLWFAFNGQMVLEGVSLSVPEKDFVAMIGPNGGGKTTLLRIILGLLEPRSGTVRVLGRPPAEVSHRIGYVPQNVNINREFPVSALDVVLMGKRKPGRGWSRPSRKDRVAAHEALDRMEMGAYCERRIGELSGGQRQRVLIARALATDPSLLILDEPTASIDTRGQAALYALLKKLNETRTIIVVSHDLIAISTHVKSVACVNRKLHYHDQAEITGEMLETMYPCTPEEVCPVELVAHGLPHRVMLHHKEK